MYVKHLKRNALLSNKKIQCTWRRRHCIVVDKLEVTE